MKPSLFWEHSHQGVRMFSLGIMIGGVRSKSPAFAKVITQKGKRSGRDGQGKSTTLTQKAAHECKSIEHTQGRGTSQDVF